MPIKLNTGMGVRLSQQKGASFTRPLMRLEPPETVEVPLISFDGTPVIPIARVGEQLARYSMLARSKSGHYWTAAPVSGRLKAVERAEHPVLGPIKYASIQYSDIIAPLKTVGHDPNSMSAEGVVQAARQACIVDECDGLPLWYKLQKAHRDGVRLLVADAIDDTPYVSSAIKTILEQGPQAGDGVGMALKALDGGSAMLAFFDPGGLDCDELCACFGFISTVRLTGGYPVWPGFEKKIITGRPYLRVGVQALAALSNAVRKGIPQTESIITVSGDCVATPCNVVVPTGASVEHLLGEVGLKKTPLYIIIGDTMTGAACESGRVPLYPGARCVCVMSELPVPARAKPCISCGRCTRVCPRGLMPSLAVLSFESGRAGEASRFGADSCNGCGACSAVCPCKIEVAEIMQYLQ